MQKRDGLNGTKGGRIGEGSEESKATEQITMTELELSPN